MCVTTNFRFYFFVIPNHDVIESFLSINMCLMNCYMMYSFRSIYKSVRQISARLL